MSGLVRKKISTLVALPEGSKVMVEVGQGVERGQFLATGVVSPVESRVKEITSNSISLTFWALEFPLGELVSGRVWGEMNLELIRAINLINVSMVGQIVLTDELSPAMLMKMVVMGVVAVVVVSEKEYVLPFSPKVDMAIGWINKLDYEKLVNKFGGEEDCLALFNSTTGRLLIVVK